MQHRHAMPFGATLHEGGGATFRIWAPAAGSAELVLDGIALPAQAQAEGWFECRHAQAAAGQRYQWRIDGDLLVPDPASRHNPEGPHAASQVVDPGAFDWADDGWLGRPWHEAVIYELHIGCFTLDGTFAAAERRLPVLVELGITALQLMPLADFPGRFGWGYDGVLPFAPFHGYGMPDELKHFVQTAHGLGLMVFGDVVYNHFGPDGNYLHAYAPHFFSQHHRTPWGAALNFDGEHAATVRDFIVHNMLYWLEEYRLDGLRFDAAHAMIDHGPQHIVEALSLAARRACPGRHVHLVLENDSNDPTRLAAPGTPGKYEGQWNGDVHHAIHVALTGESDGYYAEYSTPVAQLARSLAHGFARQGGPHNAEEAQPRRPASGQARLGAMVNFLHNHDQIGNRAFGERLSQLVEPPALRLATALVLLAPTTPMLFMGEEHGTTRPFMYFADWHGELRDAVRNGRLSEFAQFERYAAAAAEGGLPDPCSLQTFERCKLNPGVEDPAFRAFCAELLACRRSALLPLLAGLADEGHHAHHEGSVLRVCWQFAEGRALQLQANLSAQPAAAEPIAHGSAPMYELLAGHTHRGSGAPALLGPWSARWHWLPQYNPGT